MQSKNIVPDSSYFRLLVLCLLWLLACPTLAEPGTDFLEVRVDPSVIQLEAELTYSGPEDQPSLSKAAERDIGRLFSISSEGQSLPGELKEVRLSPGNRRDELSGEALEEESKRMCLHALWEFPYDPNSSQLVLRSKIKKPVSFVTRHLGVRLHDRTPLKALQSLRLDEEDPWYSRFDEPKLTRTPPESIACYLYIEPGQTRVEVLARAKDLQPLGQLELGSDSVLSLESQSSVAKQVGELLKSRLKASMNDRPLDLQLENVTFVRRTPTSADAMDPPEPIPVQLANVGAIFVGPAITETGTLKLSCPLFSPRVQQIPVTVTQGESVDKLNLLPGADGVITLDQLPEGSILTPVSAPGGGGRGVILLVAGGLFVLGAILMIRTKAGTGIFLLGSFLWLIAGLSAMKWGRGPKDTVIKAQLQNVLGNIYQAFEAPTEEAIYDRLALSVEGELLSEVYLQTRKGLEAEQGVQVKVERVEVGWVKVTSADWWGDGMKVRALWEVSGRVGHWGHEHQRTNWYKAELTLNSIDGNWKLTELEVLDEVRM